MRERIALIDGVRTPFCKMLGVFKDWQADDLGAFVLRELMARVDFPKGRLDEVIVGNGVQPAEAANIARVCALKAGIPQHVPAYTVQRNCSSGMEALTTAANKINAGEAEVILCGAMESMSNIPMMFGQKMSDFFMALGRARGFMDKLKVVSTFRPGFLKPVIGLEKGLTDPVCGMIMGLTAEILARDFHITREEQDAFALRSHQRATLAIHSGRLAEEILPIPQSGKAGTIQMHDDGPRSNQTIEALAKLRPYFDRLTGTVTAGNSSQVTDGAVAMLVMSEGKAKELDLPVLGYINDYAYAGLEGKRMGLGPVYATHRLMKKTGMRLEDFQLVELNEAFSVQAQACLKAFESEEFARENLGRSKALGVIDGDRLNVNGGAVALGHPVGATGMRLVLTLLKELRRQELQRGLATLCIGGGQGAALALEVL